MHTKTSRAAGAAIVVCALSISAATAQTVFTGTDVAEDRNEDLIEAIEDDAERELDAFGNAGRPQGFTGSVALRALSSSGNTDSATLGVGTNFTFVDGPNGYDVQLNYTYGETGGTVDEKSLFYGLEYTRDFNDSLFGFAKLQGSSDEFSTFSTDTFAGFGLGYRVVNNDQTQWSVQAGPGYRFAEFNITSPDVSEGAFAASSDFSHKINDNVLFTNDTDIIASDSDTVIVNDLAVSVAMNDSLALRTSVLTEHHTDPGAGFDPTDTTIGASLVYSVK